MRSEHVVLGQADDVVIAILLIVYLAIIVVTIVGSWKTFEKANQPGWGCIIPIYNFVLMLKIAGKPLWWLLLYLIPIVSIYPSIVIPIAIAKNFRKGTGFGIGLMFLPMIFYPILGLGSAEYDPEEALF